MWDGASKASIASGTYRLIDPTGADAVAAVAVAVASDVAQYTFTPSAGLTYGAGYMEEWALNDGAALPVFRRPAIVCLRRPWAPLTNRDVIDRNPKLTDYPTGYTSWDTQIEDAWDVIIGMVVDQAHNRPDQVLNTWRFRELCMLLSLAHIHEIRATYTTGRTADLAEEKRQQFAEAWELASLDLDTDDDGLSEDPKRQPTRAQHPRDQGRTW